MSPRFLSPALRDRLLAAALTTAAFALACHLLSTARPGRAGTPTVTALLLGESRRAMGGDFYVKADTYFHLGVEHRDEARARTNDPVQRLLAVITPHRHVHLHGDRVKEIMPWLRLATEADPHNVDAYLVAAFWLSSSLRDNPAAEQVLREAQRNNPGDYRVFLEEARLSLRSRNWPAALHALRAARACWPKPAPADDVQSQLDKGELLTYLALLEEGAGDRTAAAAALREVVALFPSRTSLAARRLDLEEGKEPPMGPMTLLNRLFQVADRHTAPIEEDEHETEEPEHGQGG